MNYIRRLVVLAVALFVAAPAYSQAWPSKPITLVIPYGAGGNTDVTGRLIGDRLGDLLGQPVVVENRGGAAANIGAGYAAKAKADGYTLLMITNTHATNPSLYNNLTYDLEKDFDAVSSIATTPNMLVVNKDLPVKNLNDFVRLARQGSGVINYGSGGSGTSQHLAGALFNNMAQTDMVHVPYKQGSAALVDLMGGRVQAYFGGISEVTSLIDTGKVKALGVTTLERSDRYPDIPSISETFPGYQIRIWTGLVAPKGTPKEVVAKLNTTISTLLNEPEMREKLFDLGAIPLVSTPEEFSHFIHKELRDLSNVVRLSGAKAE